MNPIKKYIDEKRYNKLILNKLFRITRYGAKGFSYTMMPYEITYSSSEQVCIIALYCFESKTTIKWDFVYQIDHIEGILGAAQRSNGLYENDNLKYELIS